MLFALQLTFVNSSKGQLIINEIMANPKNGSLPEYEYIEFYNNSNRPIELSKFNLTINNNLLTLPFYYLAPQQYVILSSQQSSSYFERYGNVLGLPKWYALSNTSARIQIIQDTIVIDEVFYKNTWHSIVKRAGGWSLERINPNWQCGLSSNWRSSTSPNGGTPGRQNSVINKKSVPQLQITNSKLIDNTLQLCFNIEYLYIKQVTSSHFQIDKDIGIASQIKWNTELDTLTVFFNKNFEDSEIYTLKIKPLEICAYNIDIENKILFKQSKLQKNDVIITEVLFNPKEGGVDFVEIYNTTAYPINLQNWKLGNRMITDELIIFPPHNYLALTTNKPILTLHYPSSSLNNILQVPSIPAYPNQQGNVTLFSSTDNLMDSIYYHSIMHDPLLTNVKGISLERQSVDFNNILFNTFKSASTIHEGATPGYENATNVDNLFKKNNFFLSSKTMSPNDDAFEDILEIFYQFKSTEYYINVYIYNDKGTLINRLIRNQKAGQEGKLTWNGENESGQKVSSGYYIMIAEIFNNIGANERFKKAFVVVPNALTY